MTTETAITGNYLHGYTVTQDGKSRWFSLRYEVLDYLRAIKATIPSWLR